MNKKGKKPGVAYSSIIRYLRYNSPKDTVMFAKSNILFLEDITLCLKEILCYGLMSAEGNLYIIQAYSKKNHMYSKS